MAAVNLIHFCDVEYAVEAITQAEGIRSLILCGRNLLPECDSHTRGCIQDSQFYPGQGGGILVRILGMPGAGAAVAAAVAIRVTGDDEVVRVQGGAVVQHHLGGAVCCAQRHGAAVVAGACVPEFMAHSGAVVQFQRGILTAHGKVGNKVAERALAVDGYAIHCQGTLAHHQRVGYLQVSGCVRNYQFTLTILYHRIGRSI